MTNRIALATLLAVLSSTACSDESLSESDWRQPDPANMLYMRLPGGEVIMELAPRFAPKTITNIRTLVSDEYFDGLAIIRSNDNYVAQWGDPAEDEDELRSIGAALETIETEFDLASDQVELSAIDSRDAYADIVGFADGFPAAGDGERVWLTHCYGMLGVARGVAADSGNGTSLYVITGHAPRHLDRNLTVAGRVVSGIEYLSALPRGTGPMGFYESVDELVPILNIRMGDEIPEEERARIEIMRTDTPAFDEYVESRTNRVEEFFVHPTGRIEICNVNPPVRATHH
jgi:peptidylprolyl isomerase